MGKTRFYRRCLASPDYWLLVVPLLGLGFLIVFLLDLTGCSNPARSPQVSALPTYTPYPTYTQPAPLPTYTLLPTYTPYPTPEPLPTYTPFPTPTALPTATIPPTPSAGTRQNPAKIGDSLPLDYANARYVITVTQAISGEEAWKRIKAANMFNNPPIDGYEYVLFYVVAKIVDGPQNEAIGVGERMINMVDATGQIWSLGGVVNPQPEFGGKGFVGAVIEGWSCTIRPIGTTVYLVFGMDDKGKGGIWFEVPA